MENTKKIKLFIGLSYLLIVSLFLYFFFSKFSLSEITSYDFLRDNQSYFFELKKSNLFLISIIFLALTILWVFPFLGFGSPVALMGGFIFGKWIGTFVVVLGLSIGGAWTRQEEDRVIILACAQRTRVEEKAVSLMFVFVS